MAAPSPVGDSQANWLKKGWDVPEKPQKSLCNTALPAFPVPGMYRSNPFLSGQGRSGRDG